MRASLNHPTLRGSAVRVTAAGALMAACGLVGPPATATSATATSSAPVRDFQENAWQGKWSTTKIHGTIKLRQNGRVVVGRYLDANGDRIPGAKIVAEAVGASGKRLEGEYVCDGHGTIDIELRGSGTRFEGEYDPDGFTKRAKNWSGFQVN